MHAANLDPTHKFLPLPIPEFRPSLPSRKRRRILLGHACVCMASLRTSLSSTKICQNSVNTYSLVYLALLARFRFRPRSLRHSIKLALLCSPVTNHGHLSMLEEMLWLNRAVRVKVTRKKAGPSTFLWCQRFVQIPMTLKVSHFIHQAGFLHVYLWFEVSWCALRYCAVVCSQLFVNRNLVNSQHLSFSCCFCCNYVVRPDLRSDPIPDDYP